jgi:hypothetical protein
VNGAGMATVPTTVEVGTATGFQTVLGAEEHPLSATTPTRTIESPIGRRGRNEWNEIWTITPPYVVPVLRPHRVSVVANRGPRQLSSGATGVVTVSCRSLSWMSSSWMSDNGGTISSERDLLLKVNFSSFSSPSVSTVTSCPALTSP